MNHKNNINENILLDIFEHANKPHFCNDDEPYCLKNDNNHTKNEVKAIYNEKRMGIQSIVPKLINSNQ